MADTAEKTLTIGAITVSENDLRAWLTEHRDDVVGYPCCANECPVYHWLRACGYPVQMVDSLHISLDDGRVLPMPLWLTTHILDIDTLQMFAEEDVNGITGAAVLALFD